MAPVVSCFGKKAVNTGNEKQYPKEVMQLLEESGLSDPFIAIRLKARRLIEYYAENLGTPTLPFDLHGLASLWGIKLSDESPTFSEDAELRTQLDGTIEVRINRNRPETRQRFSLAHEISHTLLPDFTRKVQCRPDPRDRRDQKCIIETLCDTAASELLFPLEPFLSAITPAPSAQRIIEVADLCIASREATIRRYIETAREPVAVLFLDWKLKPSQLQKFDPNQLTLFDSNVEEEKEALKRLRVSYCLPNEPFKNRNIFVPEHKSLDNTLILNCSSQGESCDGESVINFGSSNGKFQISVVPLLTPSEELGPNGAVSVAAIIKPVELQPPSNLSQLIVL